MKTTAKLLATLATISLLLAACAAGPSSPTSPAATPTPTAPSASDGDDPTDEPTGSPAPVGTLTVADGAVIDGPGTPLAEALAGDLSQPVLVRGTLFLDADGNVYLADSLTDATAPTFGDTRIRVENYPTSGPTWDISQGELIGLQEANGILFFEDTKLYGTISS
ncbi:MAG TPA: hypothetical protein VFV59_01620 [Candidatus Limnocylindria bacterium]|nr:hypothetical protein [Candidatus Limnocylindria bacterium]